YRLGLALLDLSAPYQLTYRGEEWVFGPTQPYEQTGDVGGVVFPCGAVHDVATGTLRLYYGAADSSIAMATANMREVLDWVTKEEHRVSQTCE
ncbi:MAG: glycosidase, partial [Blastocatellia bacterium]